jgi:hypothetical protein
MRFETCTERYLTGTQILSDPGLELQLNWQGGSPPEPGDIPANGFPNSLGWTPYLWPDGSSFDGFTHGVKYYQSAPVPLSAVPGSARIRDTDPFDGKYHLEITADFNGGEPGGLFGVGIAEQYFCDPSELVPTAPDFGYVSAVNPGDLIEVSMMVKRVSGDGAFRIHVHRPSSMLHWVEVPATEFGTGYQQISVSHEFASEGPGPYYFTVTFGARELPDQATTYRVDDIVVGVVPSSSN